MIVLKVLIAVWVFVVLVAMLAIAVVELRRYWRTRHLPQGRMVDWASPAMRGRARWN